MILLGYPISRGKQPHISRNTVGLHHMTGIMITAGEPGREKEILCCYVSCFHRGDQFPGKAVSFIGLFRNMLVWIRQASRHWCRSPDRRTQLATCAFLSGNLSSTAGAREAADPVSLYTGPRQTSPDIAGISYRIPALCVYPLLSHKSVIELQLKSVVSGRTYTLFDKRVPAANYLQQAHKNTL